MPELDGFEMAKILFLENNRTPIYALTADTSIKSNEKFKSEHFDGILHKPFKISELEDILAHVSKNKHSNDIEACTMPSFKDNVSHKLKLPLEIMNKLLKIYVKNTKEDILKLNEAFASNDIITMGDIAHKLKGSSGTIFRNKTSQSMVDIEKILKEGNFEHIKFSIDAAFEDTLDLENELLVKV